MWNGPFLKVAKTAPLVVYAEVLRHNPGALPTMDVLVLETLSGGILDSGVRIQMGNGMYCRPTVENFPIDSQWLIAINGPGSKPGNGMAISHCGEFWVKVENGEVVGSLDGKQGEIKQMPLSEVRLRLRYPGFKETFKGHVAAGERFKRSFGPGFNFVLNPVKTGWEIMIAEQEKEENLARLTPPLHFMPNPREIEGWHLAENPSDCATRPYDTAPENPRQFMFSPEVGKQIDGPAAGRSVIPEEIEKVRQFGRGTMTIEGFQLRPGSDGCPEIEWLDFSVQVEGGY